MCQLSLSQINSWSAHSSPPKSQATIDGVPCAHDLMEYMRGRSIRDRYMIIDEAQNMTPLQAFGIISRAGVGTKIILTGDPNQVDNPLLDSKTNGLTYAANAMKGSKVCTQITFEESE